MKISTLEEAREAVLAVAAYLEDEVRKASPAGGVVIPIRANAWAKTISSAGSDRPTKPAPTEAA